LKIEEKIDKGNEANEKANKEILKKLSDIIIETSTATTTTKTTTTTTTSTTTPTTSKSEVIMITGGEEYYNGKLAELLFLNGTHICELESLPDDRWAHSQSESILCGGGYTKDSCIIFTGGS